MDYKITADGWFTTVGGIDIVRNDLSRLSHTQFVPGAPNGLVWHYTAGCNNDTSGRQIELNFLTHSFVVGNDGSIRQYAPLMTAAWHAHEVSQWKIGVEHVALPGSCDLNDTQLQASAELFAAIIVEVKRRTGVTIPLVHVPGCDYTTPGIKEHKDGVGCAWNPNTHTDALYGWGWDRYLAAIAAAMTEEEDMKDLIAGSRARQNDQPLDTTQSAEWQFGWYLENRIAKAATLPKPTPSGAVADHEHEGGSSGPVKRK